MYRMIGTPITGVMALIGIMPIDTGSTLMNVQSKAIAEPVSIVTGNSEL